MDELLLKAQEKLQEKRTLQSFRVTLLSLAGGPVVFLLLVVFLRFNVTNPQLGDLHLALYITLIHFILLVIVLLFGQRLKQFIINRSKPFKTSADIVNAIRSGYIVHYAIWEGVAIMGVFAILFAKTTGVLENYPWYWLNGLTGIVFFAHTITHIPSGEQLKNVIRELT